MRRRAGFGNSDNVTTADDPGQGDCGRRTIVCRADLCKRSVMHEAAATERGISHHWHTVLLAPWKQIALNAAAVEIVKHLIGRAAMAVWNAEEIRLMLHAIEEAAPSFAVAVRAAPVNGDSEVETMMAGLAREHGGVLVLPTVFTMSHRDAIITLAAKHRLPAVYPYPFFAAEGGLMSYGLDIVDQHRRAADYVDRILKGAKPGDLPVQLPTKFELVINLRTAKALGLTVPQSMLLLADEVIE
jgi:ABC-type uncharacterized transport system substrate-binding protein